MIESRTIIFAENDLIDALIGYCRARGIALPCGTIRGAEIEGAGDQQIRIILSVTDDHGGHQSTTFDQANLGSALIHYCLDRGIRLPRAGSKSIEAFGREIGLVLFKTTALMRHKGRLPRSAAAGQDRA